MRCNACPRPQAGRTGAPPSWPSTQVDTRQPGLCTPGPPPRRRGTPPSARQTVASPDSRSALRRVALFLLLAAEAGLTGALFDAEPILGRTDSSWARLIAHGGAAGPLAIAVGTALLLFGGRALRAEFAAAGDRAWGKREATLLLVQLASFALSLVAAGALFGDSSTDTGRLGTWALGWAAALAVAVAAWTALLVPPRALASILRSSAGLLAACAATGALAWWAGSATAELWMPMRDATVALVGAILPRSGLRVGEDDAGVVLALGDFAVIVGPTCSGYEGIGLMTVFVAAFLAWFRDRLRFPAAFLLLPIGVVAAWIGNGLRLAALLQIGARISPAIAMGGFHAYSGSLLFSAIALGLAAVAQRSRFFSKSVAAEGPHDPTRGDADDYLLPWLATIATSMATGALSDGGADPLYALRFVAAAALLLPRRDRLRELARAPEPAAFALGALAFAAWIAIASAGPAGEPASPWPGGILPLVLRVAGAVALIPLVEELAFRGYLARRLVDRDFTRVTGPRLDARAIALSALAFGLLHDRVLAATIAGVAYGLALRRRGEVVDAVAAHATTNALLLAWVASTGRWDLWG